MIKLYAMAMNKGFKRLGQVSNALYLLGLLGMIVWLIVTLTVGRWGVGELIIVTAIPFVIGAMIKLFTWLTKGFLVNTTGSN